MRNGGPTTIRAVNHGWRVEIQNGVAAPLPHLAAVLQNLRRARRTARDILVRWQPPGEKGAEGDTALDLPRPLERARVLLGLLK